MNDNYRLKYEIWESTCGRILKRKEKVRLNWKILSFKWKLIMSLDQKVSLSILMTHFY